MSRYSVARAAEFDLDEIWDYVANDNPIAADHLVDKLHDEFAALARDPFLGQAREELCPGLRFIPAGNYLIFYLPLSGRVEIMRVIHGSRQYDSAFFSQ